MLPRAIVAIGHWQGGSLRYLIAILAVLVLAGCFSIPATEDALREDAYQVDEGCSQLPLKTAYEIIASNTVRCLAGPVGASMLVGPTFVSVTPENKVHGRMSDEKGYAEVSLEHVNPVVGGFLQLIEIQETDACPSFISIYRLNDAKKWRTAAESVFMWLDGDTDSCYEEF